MLAPGELRRENTGKDELQIYFEGVANRLLKDWINTVRPKGVQEDSKASKAFKWETALSFMEIRQFAEG